MAIVHVGNREKRKSKETTDYLGKVAFQINRKINIHLVEFKYPDIHNILLKNIMI